MAPTALNTTPHIHALLKNLHNKSLTQESTLSWPALPAQCTTEFDTIMRDKFIALDQDKCELVYHILRSINATNVVEAGTSFGVSTIYLALAVAENAKRVGSQKKGKPRVIATEKEESKATSARAHWAAAGHEVEEVIELRVGDLRETLISELGVVDFLLLDIWTPLALPALKLCQPHFRPGSVIVADNTVMAADRYQELFGYVDAEGSGFRRVTLPYSGGMDMIVYQ
ncbi:hypothetical protein PENANT_c019G02904 [Penicillium antarcticum]|uniref:O-methyltransferase n=1 Tax=Penicillium antarcticum TaxID=416450 RepID=A0A1V6Q0U2_9EURO|nr:uncharacterized protein N7508_001119 [Penicillium antarcticum]KAJ5316611.1 hypothetical protein N7508_001119 [Penicillium antarcticum]OQD82890.1 hypothetical protein PENANT_c019G02904 [Penicillium antarcticum]